MAPRKKAEAPAKPKPKPAAKPKPAPKPKPKPKPAAKKAAPAKPRTNIPFRQLTPEPEEPAKRRKVRSERDSSTPEWDKNVTSQNKRNKGMFKMTRASLYDESINDRSIDELFKKLDPNSLSQFTWGAPVQAPIIGSKGTKGKSIMKRPRKPKASDLTGAYMAMMEDMKGPQRVIIPNTPKRSRFLRLSFEIRERVYSHLLKYPGAILVKPDWQTVETNAAMNHSIRRVCKQLHNESTTYMFKENIIQAIFRKNTRAFNYYDEPALIASHFVSYYKHVVLDFNSECWIFDWFEKATESLKVLVAAKTSLQTLTLVFAPKRVGISQTAIGLESNPVTFADFVWYDGDFMSALRELAPQVLKIIVKKGPTKKLTISVDLTYLNASSPQEPALVNSFTWKTLLAKEKVLSHELRGLRDRFEEIYEDDDGAVKEGKCTTNEPVVKPVVDLLPPVLPLPQEGAENPEDNELELDAMEVDAEGSDTQQSDVEEADAGESDADDSETEEPVTEKLDIEERDTEQPETEEMAAVRVERLFEEDPEEVCTNIGDDSDNDSDSENSYNSGDWLIENKSKKIAASEIEAYFEDDPEAICSDIDIGEKPDAGGSEGSEDSDAPEDEMVVVGFDRFCEEESEDICTDIEEGSAEPGDIIDSDNSEDEMDQD